MREVEWNRLGAPELTALAKKDAVVLLPVGSTEQHGPHLPTGVDHFLVQEVSLRSARLLSDRMPIVVAPTVWCGLADHHVPFGGTFSLTLLTYHALLRDLCRSILNAGFSKIVVVNGHAGNIAGLSSITADLTRELGVAIGTVTYFMVAEKALEEILEDQKGLMHACEAETSMMMAIAPELVQSSRLGEAHGSSFDVAANLIPTLKSFVTFDKLTPSGVLGDARRSTVEKGEKLLSACATEIARRLANGEPWKRA
jgi:creatinine amidohydrolase